MDSDWRECTNIDQHLHVMKTKASLSHFCTKAFISFYVFAGELYLMGTYTLGIVQQTEGDNDTLRPFPMKLLFPSEVEQSPIYELLVVALFLHAMLNIYTASTVNALIFSLSIHNESGVSLIKSALGYVGIMVEILIICSAGEYLSLKNKSLADAVYESLWYNMSSKQGKDILFVIMRSQKQLIITTGGMTNLSLEAFPIYQYLFAHCKLDELQNLVDSLLTTLDYSLGIVKLMTNLDEPSVRYRVRQRNFEFLQLLSALEDWGAESIFNIIISHKDYNTTNGTKYLHSIKVIHYNVIHEILATINTNWRKCANIDQHLHLMMTKARLCYAIGNIVLEIVYQTESGNDTLRPLPMKVLLPFDTEQSPIYELLVVVLIVHAMLHVYSATVINILQVTLWVPHLLSFAIMIEIFIFCFSGEYLGLKSKLIADAVYSSLWYNMSPNQNKNLLLVIMRSQKQLSITAGGIMNLSLEAFTSVMKASASYVSVLNAIY
ncbi:PREDICTED: uncharacterized protein LOC106747952 [Dinoponera quadriceps]|uniref:Uncharacterized protein LOC106747952 n=1 Tax=Dinoponera quadriceps TaxID=609295 RepID=A0A6P3XTY2_DINQU|nr:PREDICTED: uncharacterized protein LOC106747952 [Dinoponera quadriceps]